VVFPVLGRFGDKIGGFLDGERVDANNKGDLRIYIYSVIQKIAIPSSSPEKPRTTHLPLSWSQLNALRAWI
jgi:hypothetical protein